MKIRMLSNTSPIQLSHDCLSFFASPPPLAVCDGAVGVDGGGVEDGAGPVWEQEALGENGSCYKSGLRHNK